MSKTFQEQFLLFAWLPKPSVVAYIENQCIQEEVTRKDEILRDWERAREVFNAKAPRSFESISVKAIEGRYSAKLERIKDDKRFAHTYWAP